MGKGGEQIPRKVEVLEEGDDAPWDRPSRSQRMWFELFARVPLVHSVTWLCVVIYAATRPGYQEVMKLVIEAWLLYSFSKYAITGVTSLYGLRLLRRNAGRSVEWWRKAKSSDMEYGDVIHVVAIPNYKESPSTLRRTLSTLKAQADARRNIVVVLAMEARDPKARETAGALQEEFRSCFRGLVATMHVLRRGEVGGKSSNENWAVRCAKKSLVEKEGIPAGRIVVTVCDADTYFHPSYFAALTHAYVTCDAKLRPYRFWQGCTQFYPNSDDVPVLCSVRYALLSVGFLGQLANPLHYRLPFAVYSLSMDLVLKANFWDPSVIPEDWHMYLRCFYATKGAARVVPLFFPVGCECVTDTTSFGTVVACYKQATRWQWGAIDIGFILIHGPSLGLRRLHRQLQVIAAASEHHLYYPLMWIVIAAAPWLVNDWASGWRFWIWLSFFVSNFFFLNFLDASYRRILSGDRKFPLPQDRTRLLLPDVEAPEIPHGAGGVRAARLGDFSLRRALAFVAFPVADLLLFVLPSLHAHGRMAASTRFDYVVAPKLSISLPTTKINQQATTSYGSSIDDAIPKLVAA